VDLAAYGFLVARRQGPRLLGCQFESSTFPGRAPSGGVLLRALLGGAGADFEPEIVHRSDEEIAARALADLATVAGLKQSPDLVRVWRHPRGIPLYVPGHAARVSTVDAALRDHPGLHVIGHGLRGVGVNESIRAATDVIRTNLFT
jgi:oxygen-dependent protoporphyrinogen oxidase